MVLRDGIDLYVVRLVTTVVLWYSTYSYRHVSEAMLHTHLMSRHRNTAVSGSQSEERSWTCVRLLGLRLRAQWHAILPLIADAFVHCAACGRSMSGLV